MICHYNHIPCIISNYLSHQYKKFSGFEYFSPKEKKFYDLIQRKIILEKKGGKENAAELVQLQKEIDFLAQQLSDTGMNQEEILSLQNDLAEYFHKQMYGISKTEKSYPLFLFRFLIMFLVLVLFFAFIRVGLITLTKNYLQQHIYIPKCLNFCEQRKTKFEDIVYHPIHDSGKIFGKRSHVFAYGCECSKENFPNRTIQKLRVDFFGFTYPVSSFLGISIGLFFFVFPFIIGLCVAVLANNFFFKKRVLKK